MKILVSLKDQLNTSVFILLVILVTVFWAIYKLGQLVEKFKNMKSAVTENSKMHGKSTFLFAELKAKVDLIYQNTNPNAMIKANSPATLTDKGNEVRTSIDVDNIYSKHANDLKEELAKRKTDNAYDIQQQAFDIATKFIIDKLNSDELNIIKQAAFDNGVLEEDILLIFGILLRDEYMKKQGIAPSETNMIQ